MKRAEMKRIWDFTEGTEERSGARRAHVAGSQEYRSRLWILTLPGRWSAGSDRVALTLRYTPRAEVECRRTRPGRQEARHQEVRTRNVR
jgi:hypothetical protein